MADPREVFVSVDIEASGPTPGLYSMLSIGACLVDDPAQSFYLELQPINDAYTQEALAICQFSMERLKREGTPPLIAMRRFAQWIAASVPAGGQPIMIGYNVPFDWAFVNEYFHRYLGRNPFGHTAVDIKAFYMGLSGCAWQETIKSKLPVHYIDGEQLEHNALGDARLQGEIFRKMRAESHLIDKKEMEK